MVTLSFIYLFIYFGLICSNARCLLKRDTDTNIALHLMPIKVAFTLLLYQMPHFQHTGCMGCSCRGQSRIALNRMFVRRTIEIVIFLNFFLVFIFNCSSGYKYESNAGIVWPEKLRYCLVPVDASCTPREEMSALPFRWHLTCENLQFLVCEELAVC